MKVYRIKMDHLVSPFYAVYEKTRPVVTNCVSCGRVFCYFVRNTYSFRKCKLIEVQQFQFHIFEAMLYF